MSALTKPCAGCAHVSYDTKDSQHVCLHPDVSTPSVVTGKPIGTSASVVRHSGYTLGKRRCGPDGLWWTARAPT